MSNIFYCALFMIMMFSFYFTGTSMNSVRRAILYLPIELIQKSVSLLEFEDENSLYFNDAVLRDNLTTYFDVTVKPHVHDYQFLCIYFDHNDKFCIGNHCQKVRITVIANLYFGAKFSNGMTYEIGES